MNSRPDFLVIARDGQPLLAVESHAVEGIDPVQFRRDYLESVPSARYSAFLMVVCRDRTFLWTNQRSDEARPDYCADTRSALEPFMDQRQITFDRLYGEVFEMFVSNWLFALARNNLDSRYLRAQGWLVESGLYAAMREASVEMAAAA
jgi:hypothetical protein